MIQDIFKKTCYSLINRKDNLKINVNNSKLKSLDITTFTYTISLICPSLRKFSIILSSKCTYLAMKILKLNQLLDDWFIIKIWNFFIFQIGIRITRLNAERGRVFIPISRVTCIIIRNLLILLIYFQRIRVSLHLI